MSSVIGLHFMGEVRLGLSFLAHPALRRKWSACTPDLNRCVDSSKMCMNQMMAIDAAGGLGKGGIAGLSAKPWRDMPRTYVAALCTPNNLSGATTVEEPLQP